MERREGMRDSPASGVLDRSATNTTGGKTQRMHRWSPRNGPRTCTAQSVQQRGHHMKTARSRDGTLIAFDQLGSGPPLILVDGAFGHRASGLMEAVAELLAPHFTAITYDRRGRGDSGSQPSSTEP